MGANIAHANVGLPTVRLVIDDLGKRTFCLAHPAKFDLCKTSPDLRGKIFRVGSQHGLETLKRQFALALPVKLRGLGNQVTLRAPLADMVEALR
jgi:hypothetical protein